MSFWKYVLVLIQGIGASFVLALVIGRLTKNDDDGETNTESGHATHPHGGDCRVVPFDGGREG